MKAVGLTVGDLYCCLTEGGSHSGEPEDEQEEPRGSLSQDRSQHRT
jgi:hypothetical protein